MKHSSLSKVGIAATLGLAGLMGSATGSFAQMRVVDGMFGPRTFGQPTLAPVRVIATGAPVGLDGQPLGFERARGTLVPSTGQGWSFGSPSPTTIAPWPAAPLSNPAFPVYGGGNGSAAIGMGGGGGLFPLPPNFPPPGQTTQPGTGTSTQTPGTTPTHGPQGQPANVSAQNPSATPGQNPGANRDHRLGTDGAGAGRRRFGSGIAGNDRDGFCTDDTPGVENRISAGVTPGRRCSGR